MSTFYYLIRVCKNVSIIEIGSTGISIDYADKYFSRLFLPNLYRLKLYDTEFNVLKEEWFAGMKSLKELILTCNLVENLDDLCRFDLMKKLGKLDLSINCIKKVNKGVFYECKSCVSRTRSSRNSRNSFLD